MWAVQTPSFSYAFPNTGDPVRVEEGQVIIACTSKSLFSQNTTYYDPQFKINTHLVSD